MEAIEELIITLLYHILYQTDCFIELIHILKLRLGILGLVCSLFYILDSF